MRKTVCFLSVMTGLLLAQVLSAERLTIEDVRGGKRAFRLNPVPFEQIDQRNIDQRGRLVLSMDGFKWDHAQTDHFVLHYERRIFARKVGRMAEFFYDHIRNEFGLEEDRMPGRSHIYIFRDAKDWKEFIRAARVNAEWAFSLVQGPSMYLQQADSTSDSGGILAHEMTHLVVNRFIPGRIPIWLNEGIAEWYEEFAYAAYKGIKKSRRGEFKDFGAQYPLLRLFAATDYPQHPKEVRAFYSTAKHFVGYLMLEYGPETLYAFTEDLVVGKPLHLAFKDHYGFNSLAEAEQEFEDFVR